MPTSDRKPSHSPHRSSFRTDIAGLRGIAVMLVVFCHFNVPGFSGGFIGPDIFFVLSGYLITGRLLQEYQSNADANSGEGSVSLLAFYLRRARRILPASVFVLMCTNIYARLTMNSIRVSHIQSDSLWALFFGANINFLRQSTDYFAQYLSVSPIQHYWSLSVEEQFYLFWPVMFIAATRFPVLRLRNDQSLSRHRLVLLFTAIGISSYIWMLVEFTARPTASYFSTYSRAWELALGGVLSLVNVAQIRRRLGHLSLPIRTLAAVAMVGSVTMVTPSNFGYSLVIPTVAVGVLLMSADADNQDKISRLLSIRLLTWLGTISFSLYLWHWPVLVFARDLGLLNNRTMKLLAIVVCLALATASYWLVERTSMSIPVRSRRRPRTGEKRSGATTKQLMPALCALFVIVGLGIVTYAPAPNPHDAQPSAWRQPASPHTLELALRNAVIHPPARASVQLVQALGRTSFRIPEDLRQKCAHIDSFIFHCTFGSAKATSTLLVTGDSFTEMWASGFAAITKLHPDLAVHLIFAEQCSNSWTANGQRAENELLDSHIAESCLRMHTYVTNFAKTHPFDKVIYSDSIAYINSKHRADLYQSGFTEYVHKIRSPKEDVYLLGAGPKARDLITCASKHFTNLGSCTTSVKSNTEVNLRQMKLAMTAHIHYIDVRPWLCYRSVCPSVIADIPARTGVHMNQDMSRWLASQLYFALTNGP